MIMRRCCCCCCKWCLCSQLDSTFQLCFISISALPSAPFFSFIRNVVIELLLGRLLLLLLLPIGTLINKFAVVFEHSMPMLYIECQFYELLDMMLIVRDGHIECVYICGFVLALVEYWIFSCLRTKKIKNKMPYELQSDHAHALCRCVCHPICKNG